MARQSLWDVALIEDYFKNDVSMWFFLIQHVFTSDYEMYVYAFRDMGLSEQCNTSGIFSYLIA